MQEVAAEYEYVPAWFRAAEDHGQVGDPGRLFTEEPAPFARVGHHDDVGRMVRKFGHRSDDEVAVSAAVLTHHRRNARPFPVASEAVKARGHGQPEYG